MLLLNAFIIGFTAAALPGAVQTTVLQTSLIGKWKEGIRFSLGAASTNSLLLFLSFIGVVQLIIDITWLKILIGILGVGYMLLLGINGLLKSFRKSETSESVINKRTFLNGMMLVVLHPPTIFYFIGIAATLATTKISWLMMAFASLSLFIGSLICFILVALIGIVIHKTKKQIIIIVFHALTSLVLIFFAIKLLYSLIA